jgi:hypothetical protein
MPGASFKAPAPSSTPHLLHVVRERKPRFVPAQVISEYAELCKLYNITTIQGDKYAIGFHEDEWKRHGIKFTGCERTTSENYLHVLSLLMASRVRLIDNMTLRSQLSALERRVGAGDRETVSHPQHASAHDDVSCAACGPLASAAKYAAYPSDLSWVSNSGPDDTAAESFLRARFQSHLRFAGARRW